jgi:hypothetical protein
MTMTMTRGDRGSSWQIHQQYVSNMSRKFNELWRQRVEFEELSRRFSGFQAPPWMDEALVSMASNIFQKNNAAAVAKNVQLPTGYRVSLCDMCLSGGRVERAFYPVIYEALLKFSHVCDPKSLTAAQSSQDFQRKKGQVQDFLVRDLTKVVDSRIGHGDAYLKIARAPPQIFTDEEIRRKVKLLPNRSLIDEEDCIEFNCPEEERKDHWLYRAINNYYKDSDKIKIARNVLIEFLNTAKSTFGIFRFNTDDPERKVYYFLLYLAF